jgi:signal transduction histidine kinase
MCLDTVVRAARHLLGLVNDLLDASKLELGRALVVPAAFDPVELVEEIVGSSGAMAKKSGVQVRFQRASDALAHEVIVADRVRIGQVLYNLISNAIKFSPEGGVVDVALSAPSDAELELRVRDQGIGIAEEHHALIFEKFRQVDGSATRYGGTGLGLAISKGLVELHGGRIWVESSKGEGATFFVWLPRTPSHTGNRMKPAA